MARILFKMGLTFGVCLNSACATKVFTFKTSGPAKIEVLNSSKLDEPGKPLGQTPLTVNVEQIRGKVVRISQPGKFPAFWVVSEAAGDTTEATIKLADDPSSSSGESAAAAGANRADGKASINRVLRLLLRSYQALSGKRFKAARELADQAAIIDPEIAAPHVIKGLSLFQEGKTAEAKTALEKARALDPEDKDIGELLKVIH
jgi:tetratricopeptide (TPR) repeat protein